MTTDIIMPPLSQTSDTLVLTAWLKKVGDPVAKGEALFEVETDKATLEVEAPASGILQEVLVTPGSEVAAKARIGSIAPATVSAGAPTSRALMPERAERILASPRARRLADAEGLALTGITATGPRGLIVERDVRARLAERAVAPQAPASEPVDAASEPPAPPPATVAAPAAASRPVVLTATRRTVARRLQANQQNTVPVTLTREVDATELVALRERLMLDPAVQAARPTYTDFLVRIVAQVLRRHPTFNATFDGEQLELFEAVHMGLAVDTERGLLAPVLRNVQGQGLLALAQQRQALVARALAGTLAPDEMAGGTFTLTNLGGLGIDAFTPLLNPPQIGILGLGRIRPVAGPVGNTIGLRQAMALSLTFDHRAVDGAPAARFLVEIANLVEQPDRVWL